MIGLRLLHTALESIANPEDPECESEGWLLQQSMKETIKLVLDTLKQLGKTNQVEAGAEGGEPTPTVATVS